jgi:hypothetical protein
VSDLDPSDLTEIIRRALDSRVNDIHVSLPGRVEAYYSASQTVDVTPMVTRPMPVLDALPSFDPLPVLPNVRVYFQRSKKFAITYPLEQGDEGLIVFAGWDVAPWLASGDVSDPIDLRNHHPMHAFFIPGICSDGNVITPDPGTAALVLSGADVRLGAGDASDFVALASLVKAELDKIASTLGTGTSVSGGAVSFTPPYTASPVAATLVKAK